MKTGFCFGCGRTQDEIAGWANYSPNERSSITSQLDDRLKTVERKPRRITKRQQIRNDRKIDE